MINLLALMESLPRMPPILHDFHQTRGDFFPCQQRLDELAPEQLHDLDRIRVRDGDQRALRRNQAIGHQTMKMRMKPGGIVSAGSRSCRADRHFYNQI